MTAAARPTSGFDHVDTWVFDLDNTLYHERHGLFDQVDQRICLWICAWAWAWVTRGWRCKGEGYEKALGDGGDQGQGGVGGRGAGYG